MWRKPKMDDCLYILSHFQCKTYAFLCLFPFSCAFQARPSMTNDIGMSRCKKFFACWKYPVKEIHGNQLRKLMLGMLQLQPNFIWSLHAFRHTGTSAKYKSIENNLSLVKANWFCTGKERAPVKVMSIVWCSFRFHLVDN